MTRTFIVDAAAADNALSNGQTPGGMRNVIVIQVLDTSTVAACRAAVCGDQLHLFVNEAIHVDGPHHLDERDPLHADRLETFARKLDALLRVPLEA